MTMQMALERAMELGCYARPVQNGEYAYRWIPNGRDYRMSVTGRTTARRRNGRPVEDECAMLSRRDLLDDWKICTADGFDWKPSGPRLTDWLLVDSKDA